MKYILLLAFCILLGACKPKFDKKPEKLVPKDKMVKILSDMHRMEGFVNNMGIQNTDTSQFIFRKLEAKIFKKYQVDTAAYYASYKYYLINPDDFTEMYKQVVKSIKEKNKADSLVEAKSKKNEVDTSKVDKLKVPTTPRNLKNRKFNIDSIKARFSHAKK
ncbi:MAG: DUF4296 domain-containing protein [Bacteroidota bacterium]